MTTSPETIVVLSGAVSTAAASVFAVYKVVKSVMNGTTEKLNKIIQDQDTYQRETRGAIKEVLVEQGRVNGALIEIRHGVAEIHKHGCDRFAQHTADSRP